MRHLSLTNRSHWDTEDLRRIITAGLDARVGAWTSWSVTVKTARGGHIRGWAWLHTTRLQLTIPRPLNEESVLSHDSVITLARVLLHEIDHNLGLGHRAMCKWYKIDVPWAEKLLAEGLQIHCKEAAPKIVVDVRLKRSEHARAMLVRHERALKRQQTIVRRWRAKVKYYERSFQKAALREPMVKDPNQRVRASLGTMCRSLAEEQGVTLH